MEFLKLCNTAIQLLFNGKQKPLNERKNLICKSFVSKSYKILIIFVSTDTCYIQVEKILDIKGM